MYKVGFTHRHVAFVARLGSRLTSSNLRVKFSVQRKMSPRTCSVEHGVRVTVIATLGAGVLMVESGAAAIHVTSCKMRKSHILKLEYCGIELLILFTNIEVSESCVCGSRYCV